MGLFLRKNGPLNSIKRCLEVIFQTPPNMSSKKSLFRGKFGGKIVRNSCLGRVFPGEEKSRYGYILKPLVTDVFNTSILLAPPGPIHKLLLG